MARWLRFWPLLALALVLILAGDASACPNCKEAVAAQGDGESLKQGYSLSILVMIGMPFTLLTVGVLTVVRAARRGLLPQL